MAEIYVPGGFDFMAAGNALAQMQDSRQKQQYTAMQMQNTMEDRARADETRKLAARAASAERLRKQQFMDTIKGGYMPAKTAVMGPGTVQGNTPASFDPEKVKNELLRRGDVSGLVTFSNAQEQFAKQQEQEAKAAGQSLTNTKIGVETAGVGAENVKKYIELQRMQIDAAPDIQTIKAITAASYAPGHPLTAFHEQNGVTLDKALAGIDALAAQGKTVDQIRAQMSQGATAAAKNFADLSLTEAQTAKARGEGAAGTAKYKQDTSAAVQTLYEGVAKFGPDFVNTPEGRTAWAISQQPFTKEIEVNGVKTLVSVKPEPLVNIPPPSNLSAVAGPKNNSYFGDINQSSTNGVTTLIPNMGNVPKTESQIKEQARVKGKSDVTQILGMLLKDYNSLEEMKAIPSEKRSVAENVPAYLGATVLGQEAGKAVGTKAQTLRTNVQSNARFLLTAIKNATGMSAQEMNSIPELQALQEAVTKPTQSIQSVQDIIANVDKLYGTGGLKIEAAPKTEAPAKTEDKSNIAKLSDIEHTAKVNNLSIEEVKKRVRAKGMTIEGE